MFEKKIEDHKAEATAMASEIKHLTAQNERGQQQLRAAAEANEASQATIQELEARIADLEHSLRLSSATDEERDALEKRAAADSGLARSLEQQLMDARAEIRETATELDRLKLVEVEARGLRDRVQASEAWADELAGRAIDPEILESKDDTIASLRVQLAEAQAQPARESTDPDVLAAKERVIEDLRHQLTIATARSDQASANAEMQRRLDEAPAAVSVAVPVSTTPDSVEASAAQVEIAELSKQLAAALEEVDLVKAEAEKDKATAVAQAQAGANAEDAEDAEQLIQDLSAQLVEMRAALEAAVSRPDLSTELAAATAEAAVHESAMEGMRAETSRLKDDLASAHRQIADHSAADFEGQLAMKQSTIEEQGRRIVALEANRDQPGGAAEMDARLEIQLCRAREEQLNRAVSEAEAAADAAQASAKAICEAKDRVISQLTAQIQMMHARGPATGGPVSIEKSGSEIASLQLRVAEAEAAAEAAAEGPAKVVEELEKKLKAAEEQVELLSAAAAEQQAASAVSFAPAAELYSELRGRDAELAALREQMRTPPLGWLSPDEKTELQGRVTAAEARAEEAEVRAYRFKEDADKLAQEVHAAGSKVRNFERNAADAEKEEAQAAANEAAEARLRLQLSERENEVRQLRDRLQAQELRGDETVRRVQDSDAAIRRVQQMADDTNAANAAVIQDLASRKDALEAELATASGIKAKQDSTIRRQNTGLEEATRRLREQEQHIKTLRDELGALTGQRAIAQELEGELDKARASEARLVESLDEAQNLADDTIAELRKKESELSATNSRLTVLEGEMRLARGIAKETEENDALLIRDLQVKITRLQEDLSDREEDVSRLREGFVDKETRVRQAERAQSQAKAQIEEQENDIKSLVEQIRSSEEESRIRLEEVAALEVRCRDLERLVPRCADLESEIATLGELRAAANDAVAKAEARHETLAAELRRGEAEAESMRALAEQHTAQMVQAEASIARGHAELSRALEDAAAGRAAERELEHAMSSLAQRETTVRELTDTLSNTTAALAEAQSKMTLTPEELMALRAELDVCRTSTEQAEKFAATAAREVKDRDRMMVEISEARDRAVLEAQSRNLEMTKDIASLEAELAVLKKLEEDKLAIEAEASKLARACEGLSLELEKARTTMGELDHEKRSLEARVQQLFDERELMTHERASLTAEADRQQVARGELITKTTMLEEKSADLNARLTSAEAERELLREKLNTATASMATVERQLAGAEADRRDAQTRILDLEAVVSARTAAEGAAMRAAASELDELQLKLGGAEMARDRAEAQLRAATHEKERVQLQLQSSLNEFQLTSSAAEQRTIEFDALHRRVRELTDRLGQMANERDALLQGRDDIAAAVAHHRGDAEALAARLDAANFEREALLRQIDRNVAASDRLSLLEDENRALRNSLDETTRLAEQLRSELVGRGARTEEQEAQQVRELQKTLRLIKNTRGLLTEQEENMRRRYTEPVAPCGHVR